MNNNSLFCVCVDTVPVSQRVRSYNCEIHPKEPLVGKQAKNNPKEAAPAPKRFFGGGGVRGTSSVASGVMDSHFPVWGCCGGGACSLAPPTHNLGSSAIFGMPPGCLALCALFWWPTEGCQRSGPHSGSPCCFGYCGTWAPSPRPRARIPEVVGPPLCPSCEWVPPGALPSAQGLSVLLILIHGPVLSPQGRSRQGAQGAESQVQGRMGRKVWSRNLGAGQICLMPAVANVPLGSPDLGGSPCPRAPRWGCRQTCHQQQRPSSP